MRESCSVLKVSKALGDREDAEVSVVRKVVGKGLVTFITVGVQGKQTGSLEAQVSTFGGAQTSVRQTISADVREDAAVVRVVIPAMTDRDPAKPCRGCSEPLCLGATLVVDVGDVI